MVFVIQLIGNRGVGKTTWIERLRTGEFTKVHVPSDYPRVTRISFNTNVGKVEMDIHESDTIPNKDGYIAMFDVTDRQSFIDTVKLIDSETTIDAVVGNKVDHRDRIVMPQEILCSDWFYDHCSSIKYFDISAKSNYEFEKPFLHLIRKLKNDPSIRFVPEEAREPPVAILRK